MQIYGDVQNKGIHIHSCIGFKISIGIENDLELLSQGVV